MSQPTVHHLNADKPQGAYSVPIRAWCDSRWRIKGQSGTHEIFRWQNSWGLGYGVGGRGVIKAEDLERLLREDGEACIPIGRRIP
jgi:hypothetical protein